MDSLDRKVRKYVFDYLLAHTSAPAVPEIARELSLSMPEATAALRSLDEGHHLKLLEGTTRILMAFPFSAISTPYRVTLRNGKRYFANCAWDAIAFHPMLDEPVRVDSFCDRCGRELHFRLEGGKGLADDQGLPLVQLKLPASQWWNDITRTCANTMVFLGPEEFRTGDPKAGAREESGILSVEQVVKMSGPVYTGKMRLEYDRPTAASIRSHFERLGLRGKHWDL